MTSKKADKLLRQLLILRDSNDGYFECVSCFQTLPIQYADAGHYISRSYTKVKYDLRNVNLECQTCNRFESNRFNANKSRLNNYAYSIDKKFGSGTAKELKKLSYEYHKIDYKEVCENLQKEIDKYDN